MQDLYQIIYLSQSRIPINTEEQLVSILSEAREYNFTKDITGVLFFQDGLFLQIIEGKKEDLTYLYGKICRDPRHTNISTLVAQPILQRLYGNFTMGFLNSNSEDIANFLRENVFSQYANEHGHEKYLSNEEILRLLKIYQNIKDQITN